LKDKIKSIFQEFSNNFRIEYTGTMIFDFLKIITLNDTTFIDGILVQSEIDRIRFRKCGLTMEYTTARKKMVIGGILLLRFLTSRILGTPYLFIKEFPIETRKRLYLVI